MSCGTTPSIVRSLFVTAARPMKLPTSMCSGAIAHSPPLSFSTPWMRRTFDSIPSISRAERDEEAAEILHVRLAGGVADRRLAGREDGGHDRVLGRHDARLVEEDLGAAQALRLHLVAVVDLDRRAEAFERVDVRIEPATADHVAARRRHARPAEAREQRAGEEERRADPFREHRIDLVRRESLRLDANLVGAGPLGARPRAAEELEHRLDVADARDVRRA